MRKLPVWNRFQCCLPFPFHLSTVTMGQVAPSYTLKHLGPQKFAEKKLVDSDFFLDFLSFSLAATFQQFYFKRFPGGLYLMQKFRREEKVKPTGRRPRHHDTFPPWKWFSGRWSYDTYKGNYSSSLARKTCHVPSSFLFLESVNPINQYWFVVWDFATGTCELRVVCGNDPGICLHSKW